MCDRWFYRCRDCLTVAASEGRLTTNSASHGLCGACGGEMAEMGQVQGDRLAKVEHLCACDSRCTGAQGPKCDCSCRGANHGTGRVVKVVRDLGPVPIMDVPQTAKASAVAAEWRAALEPAVAAREAILATKRATGWLEEPVYHRLCLLSRVIRLASEGKVHASRMKILRSVSLGVPA